METMIDKARYHAITCSPDDCDPSCEIGDPAVEGGERADPETIARAAATIREMPCPTK